jgi:hypothetical protein
MSKLYRCGKYPQLSCQKHATVYFTVLKPQQPDRHHKAFEAPILVDIEVGYVNFFNLALLYVSV